MEALIVMLVLVLLAIPLLLVVALVKIAGLRRRVGVLEEALLGREASAHAQPPIADAATPASATWDPLPPIQPWPMHPAAADADDVERPVGAPPVREVAGSVAAPPPLPPGTQDTPPPQAPPAYIAPPPPSGPNAVERALSAAKRWFTEGNVPVKIGMLVLLAGVAALLKYVSDQGLLDVPIELRLAGITVGALGLLVFGWKQRGSRRLFALALQGGAIGVLLLTVFAAFKIYHLVDPLPAFIASIALVAGLCVLAVVQDSRTLAVLGILAGFMAPLWLSTGSGNHVGLFSYYAVLNAGIFAIAWFRPWRVLNLLGFVFTFGIGIAWGVLQYRPQDLPSTQPFLVLFFVFYLLIPLLYARRQPAEKRDLVDGSLVFGTPLVAFSLQAAMLHDQPMLLACIAVGVAALYAVLARALIHRRSFAVLAQSHAVLAVGFATLAVPLALSARVTGAIFALEGAGLVWLGLRQQRRLPQISGALLQIAAAFAFVAGADYWDGDARFLLNPTAMGVLLIAVAGFAAAWSYRRHGRDSIALVYYLWALSWWLLGLSAESLRFLPSRHEPAALLILTALTGWLAAEVHRRQPARALGLTTLAMLALAFPLLLAQVTMHRQPFAGYGGLAWALVAVLGTRSLHALRQGAGKLARVAQFLWWLLWPCVLSLALQQVASRFNIAQGWEIVMVLLPWIVLVALTMHRWRWISQPLGAAFDPARPLLQMVLFGVLGIAWLFLHFVPGWPDPLPWLPVVNPSELAQWVMLLLAARWVYSTQAPAVLQRIRVPVLAIAGFIAITSVTLHAVHHWGDVRWNDALWSSSLAQTSLTVVWSVLGVIAWVWGSRRGQRVLWTVGAVLMAVVLAKLILIDRNHLGNLLGIASFIAYGLLCTVVGYFAPAPPRPSQTAEETA